MTSSPYLWHSDKRPPVAVVGLGYVGLPLTMALARKFDVIGFDIDERKIAAYRNKEDILQDGHESGLKETTASFTSELSDIEGCAVYVVGVPTPIDIHRNPDLGAIESACDMVGRVMTRGAIVVFESTVYPGVTEDKCVPWLEAASGLTYGEDFFVGYSPERVNPGDRTRTIEKITKVVAGDTLATRAVLAEMYGAAIPAGIFEAASIKTAEAAKVIENTQRDLNIALMNECAIIFDKIGIQTKDVLEAAGTKWNFLPFFPGLVGGHCIGVDPYYLTTKAEELGYHPQVILAGRRINDTMGKHVGQRIVKLLIDAGHPVKNARVGVLGITFKENVTDERNSKVPDVVRELQEFGVSVMVCDPKANSDTVKRRYGIDLVSAEELSDLDVVVLAVPHHEFIEGEYLGAPLEKALSERVRANGAIVDIKHRINSDALREDLHYWSL